MELRADLRLLQRPQLIPKMVQAVEMMALPLPQLEQKLQKLIEENPLLEAREGSFCYNCGRSFSGYPERCSHCGRYLRRREKKEFSGEEFLQWREKKDWKEITEETFRAVSKNSPLKRTKFQGIKRNIDFLQ